MWFVFLQIAGLGHSALSQRFAIALLDEAQMYLAHPLLGSRYLECVGAQQDLNITSATTVFGEVGAAKLRSSLTLFLEACGNPLIRAALDRWFDGKGDDQTLALLAR